MWKTQVKYFWWEFWYQISFFWYPHGSYAWQRKAQYYKALADHVKRERKKMWEKYYDPLSQRWFETLWQYIMWRDDRRCKITRRRICIVSAEQVDHKIPVILWGFSVPKNLQAACKPCNMWKGTKIL